MKSKKHKPGQTNSSNLEHDSDSDSDQDASERRREAQEMEIEALKAIFPSEMTLSDDATDGDGDDNEKHTFVVHLEPNEEEVFVKLDFCVKYPRKYPDVVPVIKFENVVGLSDDLVSSLQRIIEEERDRQVGTEMIYALLDIALEFLRKNNKKELDLHEEMVKRKEEEEKTKWVAREREKAKEKQQKDRAELEIGERVREEVAKRGELEEKERNKRREKTAMDMELEDDAKLKPRRSKSRSALAGGVAESDVDPSTNMNTKTNTNTLLTLSSNLGSNMIQNRWKCLQRAHDLCIEYPSGSEVVYIGVDTVEGNLVEVHEFTVKRGVRRGAFIKVGREAMSLEKKLNLVSMRHGSVIGLVHMEVGSSEGEVGDPVVRLVTEYGHGSTTLRSLLIKLQNRALSELVIRMLLRDVLIALEQIHKHDIYVSDALTPQAIRVDVVGSGFQSSSSQAQIAMIDISSILVHDLRLAMGKKTQHQHQQYKSTADLLGFRLPWRPQTVGHRRDDVYFAACNAILMCIGIRHASIESSASDSHSASSGPSKSVSKNPPIPPALSPEGAQFIGLCLTRSIEDRPDVSYLLADDYVSAHAHPHRDRGNTSGIAGSDDGMESDGEGDRRHTRLDLPLISVLMEPNEGEDHQTQSQSQAHKTIPVPLPSSSTPGSSSFTNSNAALSTSITASSPGIYSSSAFGLGFGLGMNNIMGIEGFSDSEIDADDEKPRERGRGHVQAQQTQQLQPQRQTISRFHTDFESLEIIGKGGFGSVVKARHKLDGRVYAIKRVPLTGGDIRSKIQREVTTLSRLNHENVVRYMHAWIEEANEEDIDELDLDLDESVNFVVQDSSGSRGADDDSDSDEWLARGMSMSMSMSARNTWRSSEGDSDSEEDSEEEEEDQRPREILFLQMEYLTRKTLRDVIDESSVVNKTEMMRLFRQIVEGLAHVHAQGIIHRDLKPGNIFLDSSGRVKIGDFGLATIAGSNARPSSNANRLMASAAMDGSVSATSGIGTPMYVAPEMERAGQQYSLSVDVFALGIIFFEMFNRFSTGMERYTVLTQARKGVLPLEFVEKYPTEAKLVKLLTSQNPRERPTAEDLLASGLMPPKREDEFVSEAVRSIRGGRLGFFARVLEAVVSLGSPEHLDYAYELGALDASRRTKPVEEALIRERVRTAILSFLELHGAVHFTPPLPIPMSKFLDLPNISSFVEKNGAVVMLPHDQTLPLARFVAINGLSSLGYLCTTLHSHFSSTTPPPFRRSSFGRVYRRGKATGQPRSLWACDFDIISNAPPSLYFRTKKRILKGIDLDTSVSHFSELVMADGGSGSTGATSSTASASASTSGSGSGSANANVSADESSVDDEERHGYDYQYEGEGDPPLLHDAEVIHAACHITATLICPLLGPKQQYFIRISHSNLVNELIVLCVKGEGDKIQLDKRRRAVRSHLTRLVGRNTPWKTVKSSLMDEGMSSMESDILGVIAKCSGPLAGADKRLLAGIKTIEERLSHSDEIQSMNSLKLMIACVKEIGLLANHCAVLGTINHCVLDLFLVVGSTAKYYSGVVFQSVLGSAASSASAPEDVIDEKHSQSASLPPLHPHTQAQPATLTTEIVAVGGRYDALIKKLTPPPTIQEHGSGSSTTDLRLENEGDEAEKGRQKDKDKEESREEDERVLGGCGVTFAVEKVISMVIDLLNSPPSSMSLPHQKLKASGIDVVVVGVGAGVGNYSAIVRDVTGACAELWNAGICAQYIVDPSVSIDNLMKGCRHRGIPVLVMVKSGRDTVKIRTVVQKTDTDVSRAELTSFCSNLLLTVGKRRQNAVEADPVLKQMPVITREIFSGSRKQRPERE